MFIMNVKMTFLIEIGKNGRLTKKVTAKTRDLNFDIKKNSKSKMTIFMKFIDFVLPKIDVFDRN